MLLFLDYIGRRGCGDHCLSYGWTCVSFLMTESYESTAEDVETGADWYDPCTVIGLADS